MIVVVRQQLTQVFECLHPLQLFTATEKALLKCVLGACCCLVLHSHLLQALALLRLLMTSVKRFNQRLHATLGASGVWERHLPWDDHQVLGVPEDEVSSESEWSACLATAAWYWTVVPAGSVVNISPEGGRRLVPLEFSIEDK